MNKGDRGVSVMLVVLLILVHACFLYTSVELEETKATLEQVEARLAWAESELEFYAGDIGG